MTEARSQETALDADHLLMKEANQDAGAFAEPKLRADKPSLRIRTRLALFALALVLPYAAYSVRASIEEARIERGHAAAQMLGTARVTAARLDDHINDIRAILNLVSAVVEVDPASTSANDTFLRSLVGNIPTHINNLTVWTAAGENVGSLDPRLRANGGGNLAARTFFKDAMTLSTADMSAEAPVISISSNALISMFGLPVRREGRVVGVVAAAVRLDSLQDLLSASSELPLSAVVTVTDARGVILARSIDPDRWVGKSVFDSAATGSHAVRTSAPDGVRDGPGADGIERIAGVITARAAPWRVYVGVPREEALAPVHARLRNNLLTAGLVLIGGLLLAAMIGEGIASPLRTLSQDASELGAGNLAHRSRVRSGEVGVLASTLNDMAEQLQARTSEMRASQEQLRLVTNNLPALISYIDCSERFKFANNVYEAWLGQAPHQLIGKTLVELYGEEAYDGFKTHIHRALAGERVSYERKLTTRQGLRYVEVTANPDLDQTGRTQGLFVMMIDITARRDAEDALARSEQRLRMVADNMPALVTYVDRDERYQFVNAHLGQVFHSDPTNLIGQTLRAAGGEKLYREIAPHVATVLGGQQVVFQGVWRVKGCCYHYQSTYIPDIDSQGTVQGYYAMTFDITALKETQRQLDLLARIDSLTELPNRRQFEERLHDSMARTRRHGIPMALMFLDIDHFKRINDSMGHGTGDFVLKHFAARLKDQVRATDVVARLAGDEFVIVLEGIHDLNELRGVASKIVNAVREPLLIATQSVAVTTSIGIATYAGGEVTAAELLAEADAALYSAKQDGRDGFALFGQPAAADALEA